MFFAFENSNTRKSGGSRYNVVSLALRCSYFYLKLEFCVYNRPGYLSYSINYLAYYALNIRRDLSGIIMGGMQLQCVLAMSILLIITHEKVSNYITNICWITTFI